MSTTDQVDEPVLSLAGLPVHLAAWMTEIVHAATASGGMARHCTSADSTAGGDDAYAAARASSGALITAAQGVQAWAESVEIEATRALLRAVEDDPGLDLGQHEARSTRQTQAALARTAAATDVQLLTGRPVTQCRDRVALASATRERAGYLRARMASGTLSAWRAITLLKETRHLDPLTADQVARHVLRVAGPATANTTSDDGTGDAAEIAALLERVPLSQATFRRRLARQLALAESEVEAARRRARDAEGARDADTLAQPFGMACTTITASRERAFAAQRRVTDLARRARAAGDARTLAQLRSDIATDLLIRGQVAGDALLSDAPPAHLQVIVHLSSLFTPAADARAAGVADHATSSGQAASAAFGTPSGTAPGSPLTSASSLDGSVPSGSAPVVGGGVGEVPGLGFLTAEQVRRLAFAEGTIWRRLVTDPVSGAVVDAASTYRPPAAMRRQVQARDQRCRAPGCEHPAVECDLDHAVTWNALTDEPSGGATHPDNLYALHRGHHNPKTRGWWRSEQGSGGIVRWTTLTGQRITTRPFDHHDPQEVCGPSSPRSSMERALAALIEPYADPVAMAPESAALAMALTPRTRANPPRRAAATAQPDSCPRADDPSPAGAANASGGAPVQVQVFQPAEPITLVRAGSPDDDPPPF
ncbi:HNH endonuclease signature motif containing protein [Luteipulveratus halotolerans]|uniref:HNH endonuclease signature motif containing protein n=1 Tax=Luteipulveratus halotolerans TaxID=1631356 RepID=UPI000683367E|nr:HNH endonuclease signature motif containing protein [Luteipulveratus halotolerans]